MLTTVYTPLEELEIDLKKLMQKSLMVSLCISFTFLIFLLVATESTTLDKFLNSILGLFLLTVFFIFLPLFLLLQTILSNTLKVKAFKKFAQANNFLFWNNPKDELKHAHFFSFGNSNKFSFCLESTTAQLPFSFFNFEYGINHQNAKGRMTTTWHPFMILVFQLQKNTPNIYIHNKDNGTIGEPFTEDQRISPNVLADYEAHHSVYAPKQYEVEALQILDSLFLERLSQTVSGYDIEFFDSKMFVYIPRAENDGLAQTKKLFALYDSLNQVLIEKMNTFSFTQIGDISFLLKKDKLSFLQSHINLAGFIFSKNGFGVIIILIIIIVTLVKNVILPLMVG